MELFSYQREAVNRISKFGGRSLVALEMGLGKTLVSLTWLKENPQALPALVVCPASVKPVWEYEAFEHMGFHSSILGGRVPPQRGFRQDTPISIINYDVLKSWLPRLRESKFRTIILDETQYLKNPRSMRTKATKKLVQSSPHLLALSGTPLVNCPIEMFPVLNMLWPLQYGNFWEYSHSWCNPKLLPWGWDHRGAKNLPELHKQLEASGMIRYRKVDVLQDLPDKVRRVIPCELSNAKDYYHASRDFLGWIKQNKGHKYRNAKRAEALVKLGYLLRLAARYKIRSVVNWANQFFEETDQKLILFAVHGKALDVLQRRINVPSVRICGKTSDKGRKQAVEQFQKDEKVRLFVGNIQAAGVGLTLTAASEVGFVEMAWRPGDHVQAAARAHRIGQKDTVFETYFVAKGTIEEDLCKILDRKQQVLTSVLDGERHAMDETNLYDELISILNQRGYNGGEDAKDYGRKGKAG